MKRHIILILTLGFFSFTDQDSDLPIDLNIRIEKEYFITKGKDYFAREIKEQDYIVSSDSIKQKYFDINVEIKNTSNKPISIWLMNCSFDSNFLVNNNYIFKKGIECDSNYPVKVNLQSGEIKTYKLTLAKSIKFDYPCRYCTYGPQVELTKLGLIIVNNVFDNKFNGSDYDLAMEDKSKWTIIWSNPLQLLGKQPEPKTIPLKGN